MWFPFFVQLMPNTENIAVLLHRKCDNMKKAIIVVIIFNVLRFVFIPLIGLSPQESYFAYYADHLSLSYYDHPPLVGYTIWLFMEAFGHSVFAVKFAAFIITLLAQIAFLALSSRVLRGERKYLAWVLFCTTMLVTSLSLQNCPDVVLVLFWTLSVWALYRAIFNNEKRFWIYAGLLMGLAFDSKFTAFGIPAGLVVFLLFSGKYRKLLASPWPYMSILIMLMMGAPILVWNIQNDFVSFRLDSVLRAEPFDSDTPQNLPQFALAQIIILMPILFAGLWWLFGKYLWRIITKPNQTNAEMWFLFSFFMPTFLGVYLVSIFGEVKYNWLIPTYITGMVMMARLLNEKWRKWHWIATVAIHAVAIYLILIGPKSAYVRYDLGLDSKQVAQTVDSIHEVYPEAFVFATDGYKTASKVSFYSNYDIYGPQVIDQVPYHFAYVGLDTKQLNGKDGLLIKPHLNSTTPFHLIRPYFDKVEKIQSIKVAGVVAYDVFYCTDYKGQLQPAKD